MSTIRVRMSDHVGRVACNFFWTNSSAATRYFCQKSPQIIILALRRALCARRAAPRRVRSGSSGSPSAPLGFESQFSMGFAAMNRRSLSRPACV